MTRPQQAIRDLFDVKPGLDRLGNLRPMPGIFPDQDAPIVRHSADGDREAVILRWGMPPPSSVLRDNPKAPGVTNVRNLKSPH